MALLDLSTEEALVRADTEQTGESLYDLGILYSTGQGVEMDYVQAHKWFNLAVLKGHDDAKICREEMADMLDKEDIKSALAAARAWLQLAN